MTYFLRVEADVTQRDSFKQAATTISQQAELIEKFKTREDALVKEVFQQRTVIEEMQPTLGKLKTENEQQAETIRQQATQLELNDEVIKGLHELHNEDCDFMVGLTAKNEQQAREIEELKTGLEVWKAYLPGQEITKTPSAEYVSVANEVQQWIRANDPRKDSKYET